MCAFFRSLKEECWTDETHGAGHCGTAELDGAPLVEVVLGFFERVEAALDLSVSARGVGPCEEALRRLGCAAGEPGCAVCAGRHQHPLRVAGCSDVELRRFCGSAARDTVSIEAFADRKGGPAVVQKIDCCAFIASGSSGSDRADPCFGVLLRQLRARADGALGAGSAPGPAARVPRHAGRCRTGLA